MKALLNKISKAFYINLDRRQDRREHIDASLPFPAERFPAVDGESLELSPLIKKLFPENFAGISKAEAACAMSHHMLWKTLCNDDAENYLILEDDAVFEKGFTEFWNEGFSLLLPEDYSLIYLGGCQPWNKPSYHKCLERYNDCFNRIKINDFFQKGNNYWHMNASSYIISKNGAVELCDIVDRHGFNLALDHFMIHAINSIDNKSLFHLHPLMSYQLHEENNNPEIDKKSDIRLNKERFLPQIGADLERHVNRALRETEHERSKVTPYILGMDGMSGIKTRHFYNNICSMEGVRYLEIGSWKGSTISAAMCGNSITCVAIDNWSEFGGPKNDFMANFDKFKGDNNATFIEKDCWDVDVSGIGKFNIYMYDGNHTETSHYEALNHYLPCLDDEFIYLVDDWNWEKVRNGTLNSIKDNNCEILYQKEIRTTDDNSHGDPAGKDSDWHNGIAIFVLHKSRKARPIATEDKKISVIIPTVWMANDYMLDSLYDLDRNDSVREVIVVNNRVLDTPDWIGEFKKVKLLNQEDNLYFNASVNLAVPLCQSDICCILNDDAKVDQGIFSFASESFEDHSGCLFISPDFVNSSLKDAPGLSEKTRKGTCHHDVSGMLMFFKGENFVEIPKQLVHYFGDIFIWRFHEDTGLQNFLIEGFNMETPVSASRTESVDEVIEKDAVIFAEAFALLDDYSDKENYTPKERKELVLKDLLVPKKTNLTKLRCGGNGDGGYVLLKQIFDEVEVVYSYGVDDSEGCDSFDTECASLGKKVYMYDGTIDREQGGDPALVFKKENLTSENFHLHIQENGDQGRLGMLLKMDIEGCEYEVIQSNIDLIERHFEILCIEFHGLNNPGYYNFENKPEVIALLLDKYDIFHMHGNNWVERKFQVPNVLEVSFVRKGVCLGEVDTGYPISGLDFPNCRGREDYVLDWWVKDVSHFPFINKIKSEQIPKKIHLSWKNKNILNSDYDLIKKGAKQLELLNPDWDIHVYNDEDIDKLLRDSISLGDWNLIKDKKITEKTDLWRLLKTYNEGGLYIDIDRYIDTPLSEIVNEKTSCVLPIFQNHDFSQDFILTCKESPIIDRAIHNNLAYRKNGKSLFFLAVQSYMHSVSEILSGEKVERGENQSYFSGIKNKIKNCEYLETYNEEGPGNHILFRNRSGDFSLTQFEQDKASFYNGENVVHWNGATQKKHEIINLKSNKELDIKEYYKQLGQNFIIEGGENSKDKAQGLKRGEINVIWQAECYERDWLLEIFDGIEMNHIQDNNYEVAMDNSIVIYSDMFSSDINRYPPNMHDKWTRHKLSIEKYFNKFKSFKNCFLVHLSDEHTQAEIGHYKYFKHVFRNYYTEDAAADNVTFFPLGYKQGFHHD